MLELIKTALRLTTDDFDTEVAMLIKSALAELRGLGVTEEEYSSTGELDERISDAVIAYCKWRFGDNDSADKWHGIYSDSVQKLLSATGYGLEADA